MDETSRIVAGLPDYIDLYRIIRGAGRSNASKAKAVDDYLQSLVQAHLKDTTHAG